MMRLGTTPTDDVLQIHTNPVECLFHLLPDEIDDHHNRGRNQRNHDPVLDSSGTFLITQKTLDG